MRGRAHEPTRSEVSLRDGSERHWQSVLADWQWGGYRSEVRTLSSIPPCGPRFTGACKGAVYLG